LNPRRLAQRLSRVQADMEHLQAEGYKVAAEREASRAEPSVCYTVLLRRPSNVAGFFHYAAPYSSLFLCPQHLVSWIDLYFILPTLELTARCLSVPSSPQLSQAMTQTLGALLLKSEAAVSTLEKTAGMDVRTSAPFMHYSVHSKSIKSGWWFRTQLQRAVSHHTFTITSCKLTRRPVRLWRPILPTSRRCKMGCEAQTQLTWSLMTWSLRKRTSDDQESFFLQVRTLFTCTIFLFLGLTSGVTERNYSTNTHRHILAHTVTRPHIRTHARQARPSPGSALATPGHTLA